MGIVAKQSARNSVALATGLLLGAVNTMYVLPKAFEGFEEGWGLLRILTAWGTILAQILALGSPSAILRFLPGAGNDQRREASMLTTLCLLPAVAFALVGLASTFAGSEMLLALDANAGWLLQDRVGAFLFMAGAYLAMLLLKSALIHRMRTVVVTVIQEVWLKGSYLALAMVYLKGWMPFETFFTWFLYSYAAAVLLMISEAWSAGTRLAAPQIRQDARPFLEYGMFALWNNGARTVAKNLDFVMVGALLGLAAVPRYTFAFFIATVVSMPLRAMSPILRSLTSKAVATHGPEHSGEQLKQAARVQLAVTAALLVAIVAGMPALDLALPESYQGLKWVVLAVGVTFVAEASGGTAGPILQFSSRYKLALPINLGLVAMTVATNYALMQWLGWGIEGAAVATGLTGVWNMGWRTSLMWRLFRIHPFSKGWAWVLVLALAFGVGSSFVDVPAAVMAWGKVGQLAYAVLFGGLAGGAVLGSAWALGCLPEVTTEMKKRLNPKGTGA
ncbi:MAG: lipopolysaccharide biosynthesis protein [Flavobacteriales bacterium]|nr:lipopolysaccharide biosynthesis protein [Flavobacteriales bacterium]